MLAPYYLDTKPLSNTPKLLSEETNRPISGIWKCFMIIESHPYWIVMALDHVEMRGLDRPRDRGFTG